MIAGLRNVSDDFFDDGIIRSYVEVFDLICKKINILHNDNERFFYFIDTDYVMDTTRGFRYENITPAYDKILTGGFRDLKYPDENTEFRRNYNMVCESICTLIMRIVKEMRCEDRKSTSAEVFMNMIDKPASHFEEAIQRMLFLNQLFWQTDHRLVGLGAWDSYLIPYYNKDIKEGILTRNDVIHILEDLFKVLHENYRYKSNVLMGDTGQIFVLGKSTIEGEYVCNDLTYLFIEAMKNVNQPDPKCLLRINKNTPDDLISLALDSISTGLGAPLLANDDVVIPCLTGFGISEEDACEYTTSACWEPLIGGKSACNNNRTPLNYLRALDNLFKRDDLENIKSFDEMLDRYLFYLGLNINAVKRVLKNQVFQNDILLSIFTYGCFENEKDVSAGGGLYGDLGITSVAMGNTIDSLYNIKKYVFDENKYTLFDVKRMIATDFEGQKEMFEELQRERSHFGCDDPDVITLTQKIMDFASEKLSDYTDNFGSRIKVGLSGAAYMDAARNFGASFDGRHKGDPFTVHISNESNEAFTEIINYASRLDYTKNQFNGNVIDFMVSPDFIKHNMEKMIGLIKGAVVAGFFEMQMNVVSSKTLIEAKKNPERFPNLIVRVWGFSSYFKDLPDEYKDVLIKRALENERKVA
ncbi:pyruvate formate lyase family protein [Oribacterium sp. FC2011]|uniref:pyruvate formate lyase family protein n=1 Tax=Oribacterium sp. FC2011 TaxID=1408311 RepID=UPI0004E16F79|nr:pyruvate formate lyase family protein [Oribacterium sp. FC2011]